MRCRRRSIDVLETLKQHRVSTGILFFFPCYENFLQYISHGKCSTAAAMICYILML